MRRHTRRYWVWFAFLVISIALNVAILAANVIEARWLSALSSALVVVVVVWLAATDWALLHGRPEPPKWMYVNRARRRS